MKVPPHPAWRPGLVAQAEHNARGVIRGVLVTAAVALAGSIVEVWRLWLVGAGAAGAREAAQTAQSLHDLANGAAGIALIVSGVLWLQWFDAAYGAVWTAGRARHYGDWSFLAWSVPVVWFFLPKRMVNDVWRAGEPRGAKSRAPWPVQVWWVLWLGFLLSSSLGDEDVDLGSDGVREITHAALRGDLLPPLFLVAAAPFAIATVKLLTARLRRVDEVARVHEGAWGAHLGGHRAGVEPPSTGTTQPVTYDAAGDSRNAATFPNSAGSP